MRENVGYTVIKSIKLPHCEFVLGEKENATVAKYVTWRCVNSKDFYYGHYIDSLEMAILDLYERVNEEIEFIISQLKESKG